MTDGLDALMAQRDAAKRPARAKRSMPPVRHPRPVVTREDNPEERDLDHGQTAQDEAASDTSLDVAADLKLATGTRPDASTATTDTASAPTPPAEATDRPVGSDLPTERATATSAPVKAHPGRTKTKRGSERPTPPAVAAVPVESGKVKPKTLSLSGEDIDWLDDVRLAGMMQRPKIDIPHSAVVRLALERLRADLTVEEVRDHFVGRTGTGAPGRPRL